MLLKAVNELATSISESSPHKFWHDNKSRGFKFTYYCCQDVVKCQKNFRKRTASQRVRERMERFDCGSLLSIQVNLALRIVEVEYHHKLHAPYVDISLSAEVQRYIQEKLLTNTPAEIHDQLRRNRIEGWECAAEYQIYYQWQKANAAAWRLDPNPIKSAYLLLQTMANSYGSWERRHGNVHGIAIYISPTIQQLSQSVTEMAMDETYGTNSAGMGLFTVLAEVDGAGIPLAYLLVEVVADDDGRKRADSGATMHLLQDFLSTLKEAGCSPLFFGCDKDMSEVKAIEFTWPDTKVQLCFWHSKRAVQKKLLSSDKTKTQANYYPLEVHKVMPESEICWGSSVVRRPDGEHRRQRCNCHSKGRGSEFDTSGRLEVRTQEERAAVLELFVSHYNKHSAFPDRAGNYLESSTIYVECVREMYNWCHARDYFRLWSYMWLNWYAPDKWSIWARSASPYVSVLKTTMIVESHWRKVKHDYLHRFNRPRIDLVTWILCTRVIPDSIEQLNMMTNPRPAQRRFNLASWRSKWTKEWERLEAKATEVSLEKIRFYHTDPRRFVCACPAFLLSRFLVCKHIVRCLETIPRHQRPLLKRNVQRHRCAPFWRSPLFKIRDEFLDIFPMSEGLPLNRVSESILPITPASGENIVDSESESEGDVDDELEKQENNLVRMVEIFRRKRQEGNYRFLKTFGKTHRLEKLDAFLKETDELERQQTFPKTFKRYSHPATMFYRQ